MLSDIYEAFGNFFVKADSQMQEKPKK